MRLTLKGIHILPSHFLSQRPSQLTLEHCLGITYTLLNTLQVSTCAAAKSLQSCLTLCDPIDGSPRGSTVPGILQARNTRVGCHFLLQCMKVKSQSEVTQLCPTLATPWTAAHQAPPSMRFSKQEYWSGVPLPSPNGILLSNKKEQNLAICGAAQSRT